MAMLEPAGSSKKEKGIDLSDDPPLVMRPQDALTRALRSATEPTERASIAPSRARSLCQPLMDTEILVSEHPVKPEYFRRRPRSRSAIAQIKTHSKRSGTDENKTASRESKRTPSGFIRPFFRDFRKAFSLPSPEASTHTSVAARRSE